MNPQMQQVMLWKQQGNAALKAGDASGAHSLYTWGLDALPQDHALLSNRSLAALQLGRLGDALSDAHACVQAAPTWPKAYFRLAHACMAAGAWAAACAALEKGLPLLPDCEDMKSLLVTCKHQLAVQQLGRQCHRRLVTAGIASACATARQDGEVGQLQDQLSQSMAAPGQWVPADWQWRPTWVPELALPVGNIATCGCSRGSSRTEAVAGCRGAGVSDLGCEAASEQPQEAFEAQAISENNKQQAAVDPTVRLVAAYTSAIASLERPKIALAAAKDSVRMSCYRAAIHAAVPKLRPGAHVLVLGHSSALLALLVAEAGVGHIGHVTAIEQCPLSYRAGCLLLAANRHLPGSDLVSLEPARLGVCALGVQEEQGEEQAGCSGPTCTTRKTESRSPSAAGTTCCTHTDTAATAATSIPFRFGNGTSPSVDGTPTATAANTQDNSHSDPGSSCEASHHDSPSVHHIKASRPADLVVTDLFDHSILGVGCLTTLQAAVGRGLVSRHARVLPEAVHVQGRLSSEAWVGMVQGFDLSALNAAHWYPGLAPVDLKFGLPNRPLSHPFHTVTISLQAVMEHALAQKACVDTAVEGSSTLGVQSFDIKVQASAAGVWNVVHLWPVLDFGSLGGGATLDTLGSDPGQQAGSTQSSTHPGATSFKQAASYVDARPVLPGQQVSLAIILEEQAMHVVPLPHVPGKPRHLLLPPWHYDMVLDDRRNSAYDAAIRRVVGAKRAERLRSGAVGDPLVVDVGAGSGLLSMMALRSVAQLITC